MSQLKKKKKTNNDINTITEILYWGFFFLKLPTENAIALKNFTSK